MVRLVTDPLPICLRTVFLAEAKMFVSAHLSSAAAGINRDGRRRGRGNAAQLMNDLLSQELTCERCIAP